MARPRNAPSKESTFYAWSDLYCGGESEETRLGRRIIHKRNIIKRGEEVSAGSLAEYGVSEEEFEEWKENGSVRNYPLPEGYEGDIAQGQSPYTFVMEKAKAELEAAESDIAAESAEDRLVRASVVGTQVFGPNPEDVLLGNDQALLPEGVEEVSAKEAEEA
jgi:hypothetical protein